MMARLPKWMHAIWNPVPNLEPNSEPDIVPDVTPPLAKGAAQALAKGRALLARGTRQDARDVLRRAVAEDARVLCQPWGLLPLLEAEGRGDLRSRLQARMAQWYDPAHRADMPLAARLANKRGLHRWAQAQGVATPRLLAQADRLAALDWDSLPRDRLVIKPDNAAEARGVVLIWDGVDHMRAAKCGEDLRAYVTTLWAQADLSEARVIVEEAVDDPGRQSDKSLIIGRDFKVLCAGGHAAYVTVIDCNGPDGRRARQTFDRCGTLLPNTYEKWPDDAPTTPPQQAPAGFEEVVAMAETLSVQMPQLLRIDLYLSVAGPLLGEITSFPTAGVDYTPFARRTALQMLEIYPDPAPSLS